MSIRFFGVEPSNSSKIFGKFINQISKIFGVSTTTVYEYYLDYSSATESFPHGQVVSGGEFKVYSSTYISVDGATGQFFTDSSLTTPFNSNNWYDLYVAAGVKGVVFFNYTIKMSSGNNFTARFTSTYSMPLNASGNVGFSPVNPEFACTILDQPTIYYDQQQGLGVNSYLYLDRGLTTGAPPGYWSDGQQIYFMDASLTSPYYISSIQPCSHGPGG